MTLSAHTYAGDVSPDMAWAGMQDNPQSRIVDVRTAAEWTFVGVVDTGALAPCIMQQWQAWPDMAVNADFVPGLDRKVQESGASGTDPIYFLCRSGARSLSAAQAMTRAGYTACYNIVGGFEGDKDAHGHRGRVNGWKASGLPWQQG